MHRSSAAAPTSQRRPGRCPPRGPLRGPGTAPDVAVPAAFTHSGRCETVSGGGSARAGVGAQALAAAWESPDSPAEAPGGDFSKAAPGRRRLLAGRGLPTLRAGAAEGSGGWRRGMGPSPPVAASKARPRGGPLPRYFPEDGHYLRLGERAKTNFLNVGHHFLYPVSLTYLISEYVKKAFPRGFYPF